MKIDTRINSRKTRAFCDCSRPATIVRNGVRICFFCANAERRHLEPKHDERRRFGIDFYVFGTHKVITR